MPRHFFLRNRDNFPVACIASAILTNGMQTDGPLEPDSSIVFAISIHNPADTYNRNLARSIALNRLAKSKVLNFCGAKPNVKSNILKAIIHTYEYRTGEGFIRLVDAARHRLSILEAKARVETLRVMEEPPDHCATNTIAEQMTESINRSDEGDTFAAAVADMHDIQEQADPEAFDRVEQPTSVDAPEPEAIVDASPDPDPDEPYPGATAERATRLAMDEPPATEVDGLTGTLIEAVCAEHPPEAEVPWTFAATPIVGNTDHDTRRRNEL